MRILISNQVEKPIYMQIKEQIEEQVLNGQLKEGEVLPSIRKLAGEINVSVITTTRAYKELEEDGFVATIPGKGSVILSPQNEFLKEQYLMRIEEGLSQAIHSAIKIQMNESDFETLSREIWKQIQEGELQWNSTEKNML